MAHKWARWLHNPCRLGGPNHFIAGGQNQKWPTSGQGGYITPAAWGGPTLSERGAESQVAHRWARWLHNPCRQGGPHRFRAGGQNQRWPTSGQGGYITSAAWGVPTASEWGAESEVAHKWARWLHNPCRLGVPTASERGAESEVAHKGARWLHNPCCLGGPHHCKAGGHNQKWPTSGQGGYITPADWGVPTASEQRAESQVAHKWARWLHNPCRLGGPHCFRARGRITGGPQVGKVAT